MRGILYKVTERDYYGIEINTLRFYDNSPRYAILVALPSKTKIDAGDVYFPAGTACEFNLVILNGFSFSIPVIHPPSKRLSRVGLINPAYLPIIWALRKPPCPDVHRNYEKDIHALLEKWEGEGWR